MPSSVPKTLHAFGWLAMLPMFIVCLSQWFDADGRRTLVTLQAMTPLILVWAAPIALVACVGKRHALALTAIAPLTTLMVLSYPVVFHDDAPAIAAGSPRFSIAYSNLLFLNSTPDQAAERALAADADVMVLVEVAPALHAAFNDQLAGANATDDYPFRVGTTRGGSTAIELWSRHRIVSGGLVEIGERPAIDVILDVDGAHVRVIGVHPYPPTFNAPGWQQQMKAIGDAAGSSALPTVLIGDFNGSRWHPSFRALLDRGWRDAHEALGHGWSVSWPMDEGWLPPAFVRIDHALFRNGATPTDIDDFDVPGSDHKGFRVEFGFSERAMR